MIGVRVALVETLFRRPHHSHRRPRRRGRQPGLPARGHGRRLDPRAAAERRRQLRPKDQVLLTYYSSEFLGAQQAYFYALNTLDRITGRQEEPSEQTILTNAQLRSAVDTLRNLGHERHRRSRDLGRRASWSGDIELRSPVSGYVLSRTVFPKAAASSVGPSSIASPT